jgi:DNA-binding PadR family transcriptional regulator
MNDQRNRRLSPEYALLGFLIGSSSHGYELHQRLMDQFGNIWHTSQSQTYNILKRLESQGFIRSTYVEQEKLPARQQLELSTSGVERFEAWLFRPTRPSVHAIRVEFITRLYFTRLYHPMRLQGMVKSQAKVVKAGLDQLQKQLDKLPEDQAYSRLALELRVELLSSVDRWLDRCLRAAKEGAGWAGK